MCSLTASPPKPCGTPQAHPENYRDLLVRVAGYSTQFVNLSRAMQDAIIARTEHRG